MILINQEATTPQNNQSAAEGRATALTSTLRVTEIYRSLQGESSYAGLPCVFVRLTGCPLRCRWCDTTYGFEGGEEATIATILEKVEALQVPLVELTGGEPLAQENAFLLMDMLIARGHEVLLETSGSEDISRVNEKVHIIMDIKCPDSRMSDRNRFANLNYLKPSDEIKFVIASRADFEWAAGLIWERGLEHKFKLLMSPAFGLVKPADLAAWILESNLHCRFNLQQHKYIWHPRAKGV